MKNEKKFTINVVWISAFLAILKITNVIDISWMWVLSPILFVFGLIAFVFGVWFTVIGLLVATGNSHKIKITRTRIKK